MVYNNSFYFSSAVFSAESLIQIRPLCINLACLSAHIAWESSPSWKVVADSRIYFFYFQGSRKSTQDFVSPTQRGVPAGDAAAPGADHHHRAHGAAEHARTAHRNQSSAA